MNGEYKIEEKELLMFHENFIHVNRLGMLNKTFTYTQMDVLVGIFICAYESITKYHQRWDNDKQYKWKIKKIVFSIIFLH